MTETPVCNLTLNGERYYADADEFTELAKYMYSYMYSGVASSCCLLLFLILSMTSGGILIYTCAFCCLFSLLVSILSFYKKKSDLNKSLASCKDV